jgi:hypothetical protein
MKTRTKTRTKTRNLTKEQKYQREYQREYREKKRLEIDPEKHKDIDWVLNNWQRNKQYLNKKTGYVQAVIWTKTYMVHRLVWMEKHHSFIPDGFEINHINGVKSDNRIENLELVTHTENMNHSVNVLGKRKPKTATKEEYKKKRAEYMKKYIAKNKERLSKYGKEKYEQNKEYYKQLFRDRYYRVKEMNELNEMKEQQNG